jgi:hypothetical protein
MRIHEIILWKNDPTEGNRSNPHLDYPPGPFDTDLTNLGTAFTKDGKVKHFWNLPGSEGQPSGPAPPAAATQLIPSGSLEPGMASWEAEPVETERPVGLHRLVPFRQYQGVSGD